jgi:replicative DNA helicase
MKGKVKSKKSYLKLSCHPNSSISVKGIEGILQTWERVDWIPDVVVIDYADILAPLDGKADTREQINQTWKALRGMSQKLHCLVVTATQADAASYKVDTLTRSNFSEDKRKHAHVTGMVGLNQTKEEKLNGVLRLNWLDLREAEYTEYRCVHVAGCLALASPAMKSVW